MTTLAALVSGNGWHVADLLRAFGKVTRAYLGVWPAPNGSEVGTEPGAEVAGVVPGSPADRAGLSAGDIIIALNGRSIASSEELRTRITGEQSPFQIRFERLGQIREITIQLIEQPNARTSTTQVP